MASHKSCFARHNWKLVDGHLVEGGNLGINGGGGCATSCSAVSFTLLCGNEVTIGVSFRMQRYNFAIKKAEKFFEVNLSMTIAIRSTLEFCYYGMRSGAVEFFGSNTPI
jgi:hypothetical protein